MDDMREKLIELIETTVPREKVAAYGEVPVTFGQIADHLIANGVTIQKHGRWLTDRFGLERSICSVCDACYEGDGGNYCPNCGARMDGETQ